MTKCEKDRQSAAELADQVLVNVEQDMKQVVEIYMMGFESGAAVTAKAKEPPQKDVSERKRGEGDGKGTANTDRIKSSRIG